MQLKITEFFMQLKLSTSVNILKIIQQPPRFHIVIYGKNAFSETVIVQESSM